MLVHPRKVRVLPRTGAVTTTAPQAADTECSAAAEPVFEELGAMLIASDASDSGDDIAAAWREPPRADSASSVLDLSAHVADDDGSRARTDTGTSVHDLADHIDRSDSVASMSSPPAARRSGLRARTDTGTSVLDLADHLDRSDSFSSCALSPTSPTLRPPQLDRRLRGAEAAAAAVRDELEALRGAVRRISNRVLVLTGRAKAMRAADSTAV